VLLDEHDRHAERRGGGSDRQPRRPRADDADVRGQRFLRRRISQLCPSPRAGAGPEPA
jgi:hypothetical protein